MTQTDLAIDPHDDQPFGNEAFIAAAQEHESGEPSLDQFRDLASKVEEWQNAEPIDMAARGFGLLTDEDIAEIESVGRSSRGLGASLGETDAGDIPFLGITFEAKDVYDDIDALQAYMAGTATRDQQKRVLRGMVENQRETVAGYVFGETVKSLGTSVPEIMTGVGVGNIAARQGARQLRRILGKEAFEQMKARAAARATGAVGKLVLGTAKAAGYGASTTAMQELVASAGGFMGANPQGGAWNARAAMRVLDELNIEDMDAEELALHLNESFDDFLSAEVNGWKGMQEAMVVNFIEQTGAGLTQIPLISHLAAMESRALKGMARAIVPRGTGAIPKSTWLAALRRTNAWNGGVGQAVEEAAQGMSTEALFGGGNVLDGLPDSLQDAAEMYLAMTVPGVGGVLGARRRVKRMQDAMEAVSGSVQEEAEGTSANRQAAGGATESPTGGDESSGGPTGETSGGPPSVDPEVRASDLAAFQASLEQSGAMPEGVTFREVEPQGAEENDAVAWNGRRNVAVQFVEAEGATAAQLEQMVPAFYPGEGRAVVVRGTDGVFAAAMHEAMHTAIQQRVRQSGEDEAKVVSELRAELDGVGKPLMDAAQAVWDDANALGGEPSAALRQEEGITTAAQIMAPLVRYLGTEQGAADFVRVHNEAPPGALRRTLEAIWDYIAQFTGFLSRPARIRAEDNLALARRGLDPSADALAQRLLDLLDAIEPAVEGRRSTGTAQARHGYGTGTAQAQQGRGTTAAPGMSPETRSQVFPIRTGDGSSMSPEGLILGPGLSGIGQALEADQARRRREQSERELQAGVPPRAIAGPVGAEVRTREQRSQQRAVQKLQRQVDQTPLPGDRVQYMFEMGDNTAPQTLEAEVLDTQGVPGSIRHRIRFDTGTFSSAQGNREARADNERWVGRDQVRLLEKRDVPAGSKRAKRRAASEARLAGWLEERSAVEAEGDAEPRFAPAPPTDSEAFKKWFGDSKVVDANGDPLVVYHGTEGTFTEFRPKDLGAKGSHLLDIGIHFSEAPDNANLYADRGGDRGLSSGSVAGSPQVLPVYLSIQNPLRVTQRGGLGGERLPADLVRELADLAGLGPRSKFLQLVEADPMQFLGAVQQKAGKEALQSALIAAGHDGVFYEWGVDGRDRANYVAFTPTQIKSATGNRGTFDPADPDIRFAPAPPTDSAAFKAWFGDSNVVDANGEPLVLYRGTDRASTVLGDGRTFVQFTQDPSVASQYADGRMWDDPQFYPAPDDPDFAEWEDTGERPNVQAVYVRAENPWDFENADHVRTIAAALGKEAGALSEGAPEAIERAEVIDAIRAAGFDGFYVAHEPAAETGLQGEKVLGVFDSEQIKSATGNRGTFNPADPDIRFAAPISRATLAALSAQGLAIPGNTTASFLEDAQVVTRWDKFQRAFSDEFLGAVKYVDTVRMLGGKDTGLVSSIRRYFGKISAQADDLERDYIKPITNLLAEHKIEAEKAGDYLHAKHAPEANEAFVQRFNEKRVMLEELNALKAERREDGFFDREREARIAELDREIAKLAHIPSRIPGGQDPSAYFHEVLKPSGMATSTARRKVGQYERQGGMKEIGELVQAMNRQTREVLRDGGLISAEQYARWSSQFEWYVPLRTAQADTPEFGVTRGLQVRGPETKMRKGRQSKPDNPLVYSAVQAANAIQRAEKNAVGHAVQDFLDANKDLIEYDSSEIEVDPDTGRPLLNEFQFHYKAGGRDIALTFQNKDFVDALKRVGVAQVPPYLRHLATGMRWWRAMVTSANPEFVFSNYVRDIQTALVNVQSVGEYHDLDVGELRRELMRDLRSSRRAVWYHSRPEKAKGKISKELADEFDEYRHAGGQIGTFTSVSFEGQQRDIEKLAKRAQRGKVWQMAEGGWGLIEDWNQSVETATRFSFYRGLRRRGVSVEDAAHAARQLTVDFSQKGQYGAVISLFYAFFSAGVGGTRRVFEEIARSPRSRRIAGGIVAYGFLSQYLLEALAPEDDDGLSMYDKVPEYEKEKYLLFWIPGMDDPLKVIMPWGYNAFHNMGRLAAEAVQGKKGPMEAIGRLAAVTAENFNPMGTAPSLNQFLAPTLLDPIVQIIDNENFTGRPIAPPLNPFGAEEARHARSGRGTNPIAVEIARAINALTGGDDVRPGALNFAGDHVEHLVEFLGGGVGRLATRIDKLARGAIFSPEDIQLETVPFLRQVYGARTEFVDQENFYTALDEIAYQRKHVKLAQEEGDSRRARELQSRYRGTMALAKSGRDVRKRVSAIRNEAYETTPPSKEKLDQANDMMKGWYLRYLQAMARQ